MDAEASKILHNDFESNNSYGIAHNSMQYDDNTQLDGDEAKKFFSIWYEQGSFYDYNHEPSDYSEGKLILRDVIFIIIFLEIIINSHIKYGNKSFIYF